MRLKTTVLLAVFALSVTGIRAQMTEAEMEIKLAEAAQNPLASLISLPFQNNTTFGGNDGDYTACIQLQFMFPK